MSEQGTAVSPPSVSCGGFDSYLNELFLFFFCLRDAGYGVVAFEGPGQGGAPHCKAGNFGLALQVITAWLDSQGARAQPV